MTSWRLEIHEELGSTSDVCVAHARAGAPAGLAVLAHRQSAGRGSRGRSWLAPPGNLNFSVLLRPAIPAAQAGVFALLAGVAVAAAAEGFLPSGGSRPVLKWPNDILLDGAKLGGILIDAAPTGPVLDWLVIGIGVNLLHAPAIPGRAATTLAAHGAEVGAAAMAQAVLNNVAHWLEVLRAGGVAPVHAAWLARAHGVGTPLQVSAGGTMRSGFFAGLSAAGELLLAQDGQVARINTGDVLLGPPP